MDNNADDSFDLLRDCGKVKVMREEGQQKSMARTKFASEMAEVLFSKRVNPELAVYHVIRILDRSFGVEPNITIIPPGRIGREFPKTFGHFHAHGEPEKYRVLYGQATLLIQKMDGDRVLEVNLLRGKAGDELYVPEGFGHCLINTGNDVLITCDWESDSAGHIYDLVKSKKGMAYYLLDEAGKVSYQNNENYGVLPKIIEK